MRIFPANPLFQGIDSGSLPALLDCLGARTERFERNSVVFAAGASAPELGLVLSGAVRVERPDFWGRRTILGRAEAGETFGESFSLSLSGGSGPAPVSAVAAQDSEILLLNYNKVMLCCTSACSFHTRLIRNVLALLARKNMGLLHQIDLLTRPGTREKVLAYLSDRAEQGGKTAPDGRGVVVEIPFNREELADFLVVDRSALSRELGKLRDEGLIRFERNRFELLRGAAEAL